MMVAGVQLYNYRPFIHICVGLAWRNVVADCFNRVLNCLLRVYNKHLEKAGDKSWTCPTQLLDMHARVRTFSPLNILSDFNIKRSP